MRIIKEKAVCTIGEKDIDIYTLFNNNGMSAKITNYGGIVISLFVPDKNGNCADVVLGYDRIESYFENKAFLGAIIGRHANRIEDARFELNGVEYLLDKNEGKNHLHGGIKGFHKEIWDAELDKDCLKLTYLSKDGDDKYPGNLKVTVTYRITDDNAFRIDYFAVSDKDTVINLTNHSYFNLSGHASGNILKHKIKIYADKFTPINEECIPTGEIREVRGTPLDLTSLKPIGAGLTSDCDQIKKGNGYDHNWVLNNKGAASENTRHSGRPDSLQCSLAAEVLEPDSGRIMEVYTTKPGIQFYSGNNLADAGMGKDKVQYQKWSGFCLETQYFPNSLKHRHFPSPVFRQGEEYRHTTVYKFLTV